MCPASPGVGTSWGGSGLPIIEAQQEAVAKDPGRKLLLRTHDKAVAYSRQAIHDLQAAELALAAE